MNSKMSDGRPLLLPHNGLSYKIVTRSFTKMQIFQIVHKPKTELTEPVVWDVLVRL